MSMAAKKVMTATPTKSSPKKKTVLSVSIKDSTTPKIKKVKSVSKTVSVQKNVQKRTIVTLKKTPESKNLKIPIVNNVEKPISKINKVEKKEKIKTKSFTPSTSVLPKPAIRSPFRFPMLAENSIAKVAHVFGILFIASGAILSILHMPSAGNIYSTIVSKQNTAIVQNATNQSHTSDQSSISADPHIFISESDTLEKTVPIVVTVADAIGVELLVKNVQFGTETPLGKAVKVDNTTWSYAWDTTTYLNTEYQIRIVVKKSTTMYDYLDNKVYTVANALDHIQNSTLTLLADATLGTTTTERPITTKSIGTDTDPLTDLSNQPIVPTNDAVDGGVQKTISDGNDIKISAIQSETDNTIHFRIAVKNADSVRMNARNLTTGVLYYLGQAQTSTTNEWSLVWDPITIPSGRYSMFPSVMISGITYEGSRLDIQIKNTQNTVSSTPTITQGSLLPTILLQIHSESTLSKIAPIQISTSPVESVEIFAVPKSALTTYFIGRAVKKTATDWSLAWDTTQIPNGEYSVFARVQSNFGFSDGDRTSVKILNDIVPSITDIQAKAIDLIKQANLELSKESDIANESESIKNHSSQKTIFIKPVALFVQELDVDTELHDSISLLLSEYRSKLSLLLEVFAQAKRAGDENAINSAQIAIDDLKNSIVNQLPEKIGNKDVINAVTTYLTETTFALKELTLNNEIIIKDRLADSAMNDSDKDGISDYDEVYLYKTNPFAADTDGDGYIDGAEITLGYNPLDGIQETLVAYESPKDNGTLRDDLLSVTDVITLTKENPDEKPRALFSGVGLPNSFVTLYIYSTPVIVTVRTSSDGGWSYIFDKELDDGAHEVYVGITDNAGNVVAKSLPFAFTKTAEAFTKSDSIAGALQAQKLEQSFFSTDNILLFASMLIVSLGLVLLLLGVHVRSKRLFQEVIATA